jgi:gliding motility-associated-like protein
MATESALPAPACWRNGEASHDLWFRFTALKTSVRITVVGRNTIQNPGGTLNEPEVVLYSGTCNAVNELRCASDLAGNQTIEIFRSQLVVGQEYLIRVDARANNTGTFRLCVDQTNPPVIADADCETGAILCDKESILVEKTVGAGADATEMDEDCFGPNGGEFDSKWFRWTCETTGSLTFTITPNNEPDDLDFVVFELPNGLNDCSDGILLRCMASGAGNDVFSPCYGPTGLREGESDVSEQFNCPAGQNNFLAPLMMEAGKSYALGISNFSQTQSGFTIDWGGTGTFLGPQADFIVDPVSGLKCDEVFTVEDLSGFVNGVVNGWQWNFGQDATPQEADTQGPHQVTYSSFGPKRISLTITTDLGCQVTVIKDIDVEPCCEDLEDLVIRRDSVVNLKCGGDSTGMVFVSAEGGTPDYSFSIDGMTFSEANQFDGLAAGTYQLFAQDIKGCMDTINIIVTEPPPLVVDAGADQTIVLGECIDIEGVVTPFGRLVDYSWSGGGVDDITCDSCQRTKVMPTMGTSTYVITVRDSQGCTASDSLTIFVEIVRPYFAPNVITTNGDNLNDIFTIYGGPGLKAIITLEVYDRWGELVYKGENFPPGEEGIMMGFGWNGVFKSRPMNPGVFAFKARLRYIDDEEIVVSGSFTIIR